MCLQQMVLQIYGLLGNFVFAWLLVQLCSLQPPYVYPIGCVHAFTTVEMTPGIAIGVTVVRISQVCSDVGAVDLQKCKQNSVHSKSPQQQFLNRVQASTQFHLEIYIHITVNSTLENATCIWLASYNIKRSYVKVGYFLCRIWQTC